MTARASLAVAIAAAISFASSRAAAHPCDTARPGAGEPIRVALGPADLGVQPDACAATMVAVEARGALLVATDDFYGNLLIGGAVRGRIALRDRAWVSFMAPGADHRYVANATVDATGTTLGAGSLGIHFALPTEGLLALAPFARVISPTETAFEHAARWGFDQGISAVARLGANVEIVGGWNVMLLATTGSGRTDALLVPSASADAVYRPARPFGVAVGAAARFVPIDPRPFESFDPRVSLRFYPSGGFFATLSAVAPMFGRDRTDGGVTLAVGWYDRH